MRMTNTVCGTIITVITLFSFDAIGQVANNNGETAFAELNQQVLTINESISSLSAVASGLSRASDLEQVYSICSKFSESEIQAINQTAKAEKFISDMIAESQKPENANKTIDSKKLNGWNNALLEAKSELFYLNENINKLKTYRVFDRVAVTDMANKISGTLTYISNELKKIN
ncbi:MAG: hypothetical protein HYU69_14455 [Bacteroidetes bacterium]|nr:hypothetical protein [Bacteroidota bacterium]